MFVVNHANLMNAQDISGNTLATELDKLADSIGWSFLQGEYNKLQYQETRTDGEK